ncbi:hypothetical protein [Candidatus Lokiarchaeum ossiferum]
MSIIAQKKESQKQGSEVIFTYMGLTFIVIDIIATLLFFIMKWAFTSTFMVPIMYYLLLAGLCLGMKSYISEHKNNLGLFNNWYFGLIFIGLLTSAIMGAYMW